MVTDADHMRRALFHAGRSEGVTTPNPMVGAVIVTEQGIVAGYGRHPRAGEPHAEVFALEAAGARARGATMYVTLEPCCHVGRAGIRRVVAAMRDPNPLVSGRGFAALRAAGIAVEVGLLESEAARLNRAFTIVQTQGRPMVIAKVATSKDSKIASAPGRRTALTSGKADRRTQRLRAAVDAIGVGSETVIADDPFLTVRDLYRSRRLRSTLARFPASPAVLDARRRAGHNNDNGGRDRPRTRKS
jgi:diaminohydroxyphosphoribosylaminopyrimidine deaminase/5-amino-6-(5-phosphoribosylamino)uracil reductase